MTERDRDRDMDRDRQRQRYIETERNKQRETESETDTQKDGQTDMDQKYLLFTQEKTNGDELRSFGLTTDEEMDRWMD